MIIAKGWLPTGNVIYIEARDHDELRAEALAAGCYCYMVRVERDGALDHELYRLVDGEWVLVPARRDSA